MTELDLINSILERERLAQFASNAGAGPRVFSAWFAFDSATNSLIFTSNRNRNHSHEWEADDRAGGTVLGVTPEGLGQKVEAVSFFGSVQVATGDRLREIYDIYAAKWPQVVEMIPINAVETETTDMRFYEVKVSEWVLFSEIQYPDAPRVSVPTNT